MLDSQAVVQKFGGLELTVAGRKEELQLTVEVSPSGVMIEAQVGRKKHKFRIASKRLARHLFFSSGRSIRDAEIGERLVAQAQRQEAAQ